MDQDTRAELFQQAFGQDDFKAPRAITGKRWRVNQAKSKKLTFEELYQIQELQNQDVPYADLPEWILDNGYVEPTKAEKKLQQDLTDKTGLSISERRSVFNAALADTEALASMTTSEILRDSAALDDQIKHFINRYGNEAVKMLKEVDGEAAAYVHSRLALKAAEEKATSSDESIRQELKAAQEAIAAQDSTGLQNVSNDAIQAELARRASIATQDAAAQGE
ncbi:hypothetical protein SynBIOSE41_01992 [Synechococcus sp. BIOS-E4-1]|uniref:hypothetical protein n=1 Tax=Synechococcus sp. BIOS-E4-1 TaxID=1400864 RepID=UPI0016492A43|nr:hypothetical protein [Synechococcus sp. BIOS-E4-1]QNI54498.1 hypothetical protein SynBIOSE41_01992 [Synechococcus sp. BIOS-E4-1]